MDNYGSTAGSVAREAIKPAPELGRLKAAAERVGRATGNVQYFLNRFHGPGPETPSGPTDQPSDCYWNDLESLFNALDRLEAAVSALDHIG